MNLNCIKCGDETFLYAQTDLVNVDCDYHILEFSVFKCRSCSHYMLDEAQENKLKKMIKDIRDAKKANIQK